MGIGNFFIIFISTFILFTSTLSFSEEENVNIFYQYMHLRRAQFLETQSKNASPRMPISIFEEGDGSLELNRADSTSRARLRTKNDGGKDDDKAVQERIRLDGSLHLFNDMISFSFGTRSGDSASSGYNQISGGKGQEFPLYARTLYTTLSPLEPIRFSVGSFSPYYGIGTEATLKDQDVYVTGYRLEMDLQTLLEKHIGKVLGKVTAESSYYGDTKTPDVFDRLDRLENNNNNSILVESVEFLDGFKVAVGFERFKDQNLVPLQAKWRIDNLIIKNVIAESLLNADNTSYAAGVHASGEPMTQLQVIVGATFISDEFDYPNGDKYPKGERFDITVTYTLPYGFSLEGFYSDEILHTDDGDHVRTEFLINWNAIDFYREMSK